jgi:hypothetical protein
MQVCTYFGLGIHPGLGVLRFDLEIKLVCHVIIMIYRPMVIVIVVNVV